MLDPAGTVSLRGQVLPLPLRQSVGAALPEAASAGVDSGSAQPRVGAVGGGTSLPLFWLRRRLGPHRRVAGDVRGQGGGTRLPGGSGEFRLSAKRAGGGNR